MDIGAHTVSHPILASLDEGEARAEIILSKRQLEDITGSPVELFAYPNGKPSIDYRARDVALVRQAGFAAAVSTVRGVADSASDPFQLPRFGPWDQSPGRFGARLFLNALRRSPRGHESQVLQ
jgi:peptidoglycan/xylan/chitin deacetylase (PgdA/CDA1 family)